jgi:hypothetical protein
VSGSPSPMLRGVFLGARLGFARLRHRRTAGALLLAAALAVTGAWIELAAGSLGAVDRALAGTFRLVLPLLTFALAASTVLLAHSPSAPPLARDLLLSSWIGAVTAPAYAAWVAFGGTFWRGRGRYVPIVADFLIGGSTGLAGALLPRAHASSLLGLASGPLSLPPPASFAVLFGLTAALLGATALRSGR